MMTDHRRTLALPLLLWSVVHRTTCAFSFLQMSSSAPRIATPSTVITTGAKSDRLFASHWNKRSLQPNTAVLTYLEINGWIVTSNGVTILIDPILEGSLDFGIPALYKATKRVMPSFGLLPKLPPIDGVVITQGLDDHAHARTLRQMALQKEFQIVPIIAPPSAKRTLDNCGFTDSNVKFIAHGEEVTIYSKDLQLASDTATNNGLSIRATTGALVGPPWQVRENGYIIGGNKGSSPNPSPSLYIEPHVEFTPAELERHAPVDMIITPVVGQGIKPGYELVHGPVDSLRLIQTLRPKVVFPMNNGDIEQEGPASALVQEIGSMKEFRLSLQSESWGKGVELVQVIPGQDMEVTIS